MLTYSLSKARSEKHFQISIIFSVFLMCVTIVGVSLVVKTINLTPHAG